MKIFSGGNTVVLFALFLIIFISSVIYYALNVKYMNLVYMPESPIVVDVSGITKSEDGCEIEMIKDIKFKARVLSKVSYRGSKYSDSDHVPYDIVFGWGNLTDKKYLEKISITQNNRYFFYNYDKSIDHSEIIEDFDNFHIINNFEIKNIEKISKHDNVYVEGYLANMKCKNFSRKSSTSFSDRSSSSCEQIYITKIIKL